MIRPVIVVLGPSGLSIAKKITTVIAGCEIHGLAKRLPDADVTFDDAMVHIGRCFRDGRALIGVCASGILVRAVAPFLRDKFREPPVVAVAEDGSSVVPLIGGHSGANDIARQIAAGVAGHAAITTAGEVVTGTALDAPPDGWVLCNRETARQVMADIVAGCSVAVDPALDWLDGARFDRRRDGDVQLTASIHAGTARPRELVYHPKRVVIGVGSDRGCPPAQLIDLVETALDDAGVAREAVACIVSIARKADEPAVHAVAEHLDVPARFLEAGDISPVADLIPNPSTVVAREVGVAGVAEGAALAASGAKTLLVEKLKSQRATCAVAVANRIVEPREIGRARGSVAVVGVGPGVADWRTGEAVALLHAASDWVGYGLYLDLIGDLRAGQLEHRFALGDEEQRVRDALELAGRGRDVALVCSGDAGIYAMAALACEIMALDPADSGLSEGAHRVALTVAPGVSAFQAAAARVGAPIGHDFCCISLSDLLTPWPVIARRVQAAADGDFVVAFYNPRSLRRQSQLDEAIALLRPARPAHSPVIVASNLGRPGEKIDVTTLATFDSVDVDMLSIVMVGSSTTTAFQTGDGRQIVFTPRGYAAKREAAE